MNEFVGFTISGLTTAGIFAIVACGLTLTYTTTGIFNWAHGALVAVGAFVYWQLTVDWGLPVVLGLVICLGILGPVMGVLLSALTARRLQGTSETTKMVVTLALLLGIVAGLNWIWVPSKLRTFPPFFGGQAITISGQRIPYADLTTIAVSLLVAAGLYVLLYRVRAGVEMRAVVDDRTLATLNGTTASRTDTRSWAISATLAVLAGILIAPKGTLSGINLALLIVNAYAAAVIGRLRSLPRTFLGALIIGLANDYGQGYIGSRAIPGQQYLTGMIDIIPVLVLFVVLLLLPQSGLRGLRALKIREVAPMPTWRGSGALAVGVVVVTLALLPLVSPGDLNTLTKVWGLAIVALSLVPLVGWAGRLSTCPLAFAAVGAIVTAHLGSTGNPVVLVAAALVAALVGLVVALPALRLSGLYLALATSAFAVMLDRWIFTLPKFTAVVRIPFTNTTLYRRHDVTIFQGGSLNITRFRLFGLDTSSDKSFLVFGSVVFAALVLLLTALRRSRYGLRLIALRDSPIASATLGLGERLPTLALFALSAALAGVGGALFGAALQRPSVDPFGFFTGLSVLLAVVILGVTSVGSALGAGLFLGGPTLSNLLPQLSQLSATLIGLAGIGLGENPNGILPTQGPKFQRVLSVRRAALLSGAALVVLAYVLAATGIVDNWVFVGLLLLLLLVAWAGAATIPLGSIPTPADSEQVDRLSAQPELLGLTAPFTDADLQVLGRELSLPDPAVGAVRHGA